MSYGEKIIALRKSKGMTQAELGAELNVTYQAVSKWERDESDPDFATMSKIAKLFDVPLSFFEEEAAPAETHTEASAETPAEEHAEMPEEEVSIASATAEKEEKRAPLMLGVCTVCGKTVYEGNVGQEEPTLVCKACKVRKTAERERAEKERRQRAESAKRAELARVHRRRNIGLIASACITGGILLVDVIASIASSTAFPLVLGGVAVILLFLYPFVAQLFWDGFIVDVVLMGVKVVGTPGVIFTLDLEGIIFLIIVKILFAILKFILLILIFLFMLICAIVLSPFAFFPQLIKLNRGEEL